MSNISSKIGFLGSGQMATALATGFVNAGLISASQVYAADPFEKAREQFAQQVAGATVDSDNKNIVSACDVLFIAVKPQFLEGLAQTIGPVPSDKLIVSIAAGIQTKQLESWLGTNRIIRVMPNTPCLVGESAAGFCVADGATEEDVALVEQLLGAVGLAYRVEERLMDSVTGLSGSGPAYVYIMIEALSDAGVRVGLPRDIATKLAAQTVKGAAQMVLQTEEHPAALKDKVTSPGGTTIAGLQALEDHGFRSALINAVVSATERSKELGA
ncbi:MAG: pyrroline-5-carboxylate reductase [Blastopirellula sp.]|nr:MAG: pyrroline-5-carboxylate reductase [Blastopirellula sp.]